jgi:multiple sugar transport system ATP-binding protein
MVFQNYALYPHMTVRDNLGYGLKVRRTPKPEIARRVDDVARLLRLDDLLERKPAALSGGQRQRVAMGRAIVREPAAFLMDEPLSNLDAKLRVGMRAELARLHDRLGVTTVYVTHDQVEAMTLGQRVAVMQAGRIQQVDTPAALYDRPANVFVAAFMGSPSMNLVHATVDDDHVCFAGRRIPLDPGRRPGREGAMILGIRPHNFQHDEFADPALPRIDVEATVVEVLGSELQIIFQIDAPPVRTDDLTAARDDESRLLADDRSSFTAAIDARSPVRPGTSVRLGVDPTRFHFFDPDTGRSLTPTRAPAYQPA